MLWIATGILELLNYLSFGTPGCVCVIIGLFYYILVSLRLVGCTCVLSSENPVTIVMTTGQMDMSDASDACVDNCNAITSDILYLTLRMIVLLCFYIV
jgi:hypothetical protein